MRQILVKVVSAPRDYDELAGVTRCREFVAQGDGLSERNEFVGVAVKRQNRRHVLIELVDGGQCCCMFAETFRGVSAGL